MTELKKSMDTFKKMDLVQLKSLRDAFERDLERGGDVDYVVARIAMINSLILERILEEVK